MHRWGIVGVIAWSLVVGGAPAWSQPVGDRPLMPADGFSGWKRAPGARVYTEADLYGYIDGGAELFLEFGFEQLTQQKYAKGGAGFTVDVYRMRDSIAALGIYLMKCGTETRWPGLTDRHTVSRHQLLLVRDRFFVIISSASGQEALVADLAAFAGALASRMPATKALPILAQLPAAGQVAGTLRLVRGPYALQSIYTLGDGDILRLGGTITAVAADYAGPGGGDSRIVVRYPSPAAAGAAFAFLTKNLDRYLKPIEQTASRLVFSDFQGKYGRVSLQGAVLDIRVNLPARPAK